jgi:hypothetical protein
MVKEMIRHFFDGETITFATVLGAVSGSVALTITSVNVYIIGAFIIALLLLMSLDLAVTYLAKEVQERRLISVETLIFNKLILLVFVAMSGILDAVIYTTMVYLPWESQLVESGFAFVTVTTLLWMIAAEAVKITDDMGELRGRDTIPPTILITVQQIEKIMGVIRKIDLDEKGKDK